MMVPSSKANYFILAGGPCQHNLISLSLQIGNKAPRLEVYTTCQHWGTAIHTTGLYTQYWYNAIWWYWIDVDSTSMIFSMLYSLDSHGYPETHNGIARSIAMPTLPDGWRLAFNRRSSINWATDGECFLREIIPKMAELFRWVVENVMVDDGW